MSKLDEARADDGAKAAADQFGGFILPFGGTADDWRQFRASMLALSQTPDVRGYVLWADDEIAAIEGQQRWQCPTEAERPPDADRP